MIMLCMMLLLPLSAQGESEYKTRLSKDIHVLEIVRKPLPAFYGITELKALPVYNQTTREGLPSTNVDLRNSDISKLDLKNRIKDLIHADFNSRTVWTKKLPKDFVPNTIMELGKTPGLGIRELHKRGITGAGVNIAIIDQSMLVDHIEYKDRLKSYEEIHWELDRSEMHGPSVASIAVGKTVGVAPGAQLYYIAERHGTFVNDKNAEGKLNFDLSYLAQSIDRIIEINKTLPKKEKIRVVSISLGIGKWFYNYELALQAIDRAAKENIYVVHVSDPNIKVGLSRNPLKDPDDYNSYGTVFFDREDRQLVSFPMDSRTVASPTGNEDYVFYNQGGMSWVVPYVAGLYALACQVKPDITPQIFWQKIFATSIRIKDVGTVADPVKFIGSLK
jgi:hypothetical protein